MDYMCSVRSGLHPVAAHSLRYCLTACSKQGSPVLYSPHLKSCRLIPFHQCFCTLCSANSSLNPKVWYNMYITTADVRGAGTDAEVHIALMGSEGGSGKITLPSRPEHFERGCRDKFRYLSDSMFPDHTSHMLCRVAALHGKPLSRSSSVCLLPPASVVHAELGMPSA